MIAPLVLASGSPRRRAALAALGIGCEVLPAADDGPAVSADPAERVLGHARHKARSVSNLRPQAFVLAGDTLVVHEGVFFSKPRDRADAERMLRSLSASVHEVWTATLLLTPQGCEHSRTDCARVQFRELPEAALQDYLAGTEWSDKAGAYGIQGWAGQWAELREGTLDTVIGFDPGAVRQILAAAEAAR